jgi:hypothetical protein
MKFGKEKSSGSYRAQRPVGLRKSGIPDSVETPAPVNATTRPVVAISSAARSSRTPISSVPCIPEGA